VTTYAAAPDDTLSRARDDYFRANHFGPDGGYADRWVDFKLGPLPMPFPNTASRVRAVRFHDLHHALTGYGTDFLGELEISAWELGSGCADHWAAWQLNLSGLAAGVFAIPRRTFRAFVRGRHTRNLYRARYEEVLERRVAEVRADLGLDDPPPRARLSDTALFALAFASGLVVGGLFFALTLPAALLLNLVRSLQRRSQ
jgi:hypothetical protein